MSSPSRRASSNSAFSLLELLITIAVIAILLALAVPIVGSGIRSSNTAGCASNLRQIGAAMLAHAADNDGELPNANNSIGRPWDMQLAAYLGLDVTKVKPSSILTCKEDKRAKVGTKSGDWRRSYTVSARGSTDDIGVFGRSGGPSRKLSSLPHPQLTVMMAEWFTANNIQFATNYTCVDGWRDVNAKDPSHHGKGANYVFCDGHLELLTPRDVATSPKITGWKHGRWGTGIQP